MAEARQTAAVNLRNPVESIAPGPRKRPLRLIAMTMTWRQRIMVPMW
jgi:hypothetical protein